MIRLPKHYWQTLVDYYFRVNPPRDEDTSTFGDEGSVNVDKLDPRQKMLMAHDWGQETIKGDPT